MTKRIAILQNKGGVGKTTVSQLFIDDALNRGMRVLALDLDPQCSLSKRYLKMPVDLSHQDGFMPPVHPEYDPNDPETAHWDGRSSTADFYLFKLFDNDDGPAPEIAPYPAMNRKNLDILPGHKSRLLQAERVHDDEVEELVHNRLKIFLDQPVVQQEYDVVVIDTPPSMGPLTISAMKAATHAIIPTVMEPMAIEGLFGMIQLWVKENRKRPPKDAVQLLGILPNMFRNVVMHRDLLEQLSTDPATSDLVIPHKLHHLVAFSESDIPGSVPESIFTRPEKDKARKQTEDLFNFIGERLYG